MSLFDRENFLYEDDDVETKAYKLPKLVMTKPEVIPIQKAEIILIL